MSFADLVTDLERMRSKRASKPVVIRKSLMKAIPKSPYQPKKPNATPTTETRQATAEELKSKLDALMQRASDAFESGEITGHELSQFETWMNRHVDALRNRA